MSPCSSSGSARTQASSPFGSSSEGTPSQPGRLRLTANAVVDPKGVSSSTSATTAPPGERCSATRSPSRTRTIGSSAPPPDDGTITVSGTATGGGTARSATGACGSRSAATGSPATPALGESAHRSDSA